MKVTKFKGLIICLLIGFFTLPINVFAQKTAGEANSITEQIKALKEEIKKRPHFKIAGVLKAGKDTKYSVNSVDFYVNNRTIVYGRLEEGAAVVVHGIIEDSKKKAKKIIVSEESMENDIVGEPDV